MTWNLNALLRMQVLVLAMLLAPIDCLQAWSAEAAKDQPVKPAPSAAGAENPNSAEKISLGRSLFFDERLSSDGTISCASCHVPSFAFADRRPLSLGVDGKLGTRHAPSLVNAAHVPRLMWDGKALGLEDQVRYPLNNPNEMNMTDSQVLEFLKAEPNYTRRFAEAFGDEEITFDRVSQAIASFVRTLTYANAPFDRFLAGDEEALSGAAARGWDLFRGEAGCAACHKVDPLRPLFTDFGFHNTGLAFQAAEPDLGRYSVTKLREDKGRFRTPSLRNIAATPPYTHDGRFNTLREVIDFYDAGGYPNRFLDPLIRPLGLSEQQKQDLEAFLESLTSDGLEAWGESIAAGPAGPADTGPQYEVVAGGGSIGDGGPATAARIAGVGGVAVAADGTLYFSDIGNNRVRRVDPVSGRIETVFGTGLIGPQVETDRADRHRLFSPGPLALSPDGKRLYVAEVPIGRVLALDLGSGTFSDLGQPEPGFRQVVGMVMGESGPVVVDPVSDRVWEHDGMRWRLLVSGRDGLRGGPRSLARDGRGNLFIAEFFSHRVVQWTRTGGRLELILGTGRPGRGHDGRLASISPSFMPDGLAIAPDGALYVAELGNNRVIRIDPKRDRIGTVAQSEKQSGVEAWKPSNLAVDAEGGIWIGDILHNRVIHFAREGAANFSVKAGGYEIGDGGHARDAVLAHPGRVTLDDEGNLYIADTLHHRVRRVDARSGQIETIAGTGVPGFSGDGMNAAESQLNYPAGLLVKGKQLLIGDYYNNLVRSVDLASGRISSVAGSVAAGEEGDGGPAELATLINPQALASVGDDRIIVTSAVSPVIRVIDLQSGMIDRVAIDEKIVPASPTQVFYGVAPVPGGFVAVDGVLGQVIRMTNGKTEIIVPPAELNHPMDVAVSPNGTIYICDSFNDRIVRLNGTALESVVSGLGRPRGMAISKDGDLYIADTFHNRILRVPQIDRVGHLRVQ